MPKRIPLWAMGQPSTGPAESARAGPRGATMPPHDRSNDPRGVRGRRRQFAQASHSKAQGSAGSRAGAVANRSEESGDLIAREFGIARVYADWREPGARPDIDAVCIGTWPNTHSEITRAVLEHGKHVMLARRMAMNAAEARTMLDAARRAPQLVTQLVPAPNTLEVDSTLRPCWPRATSATSWPSRSRPTRVNSSMPRRRSTGGRMRPPAVSTSRRWASAYEALMRWHGPARRVMALTKIAVPPGVRTRRAPGRTCACPITSRFSRLLGRGASAHMRFSTVTAPRAAQRGVDLRDGGHAQEVESDARRVWRTARRQGPARDPDPRRATASGWRVEEEIRQRDPWPGEGHAHDLRGRRALHGVHRGRLKECPERSAADVAEL